MVKKIESHRDLLVWQKGMDLVIQVYNLTNSFPTSENYRLVSQITRSVVSVPANIAEGYNRSTSKDYAHFLSIAKGSLMETETFIMLAVRLGYINEENAKSSLELVTEVSKMLTVLRKRLLSPVPCPL